MTSCEIQAEGQSFQHTGLLKKNINSSLIDLEKAVLQGREDDTVYYYVITTVDMAKDGSFIQYGSAPNFQGGVITLCTCKHWMRSTRSVENWKEHKWVAGFSGRNVGEQALVYLMKVGEVFESYQDLWSESTLLTESVRQKKLAQKNIYGDLYQPTGKALPFDPENYVPPRKDHVHIAKDYWYKDVDYRYKRPSALLVGEPDRSYLWNRPLIHWSDKAIGRNHRRKTISELFHHLEGSEHKIASSTKLEE